MVSGGLVIVWTDYLGEPLIGEFYILHRSCSQDYFPEFVCPVKGFAQKFD
jgi:hypothetical protein